MLYVRVSVAGHVADEAGLPAFPLKVSPCIGLTCAGFLECRRIFVCAAACIYSSVTACPALCSTAGVAGRTQTVRAQTRELSKNRRDQYDFYSSRAIRSTRGAGRQCASPDKAVSPPERSGMGTTETHTIVRATPGDQRAPGIRDATADY